MIIQINELSLFKSILKVQGGLNVIKHSSTLGLFNIWFWCCLNKCLISPTTCYFKVYFEVIMSIKPSIVRIRPVTENDLETLYELASKTGGGLTNLPMDRDDLLSRITKSNHSLTEPNNQSTFLLIAERVNDNHPLGVVGLFVQAGAKSGFYTYKIETHLNASKQVDRKYLHDVLVLSGEYSDYAEIGALFVDPDARGKQLGKALVRASFLFVKQHRSIFPNKMCAEMRGWQGPNGEKPFWDEFLIKFFDMDFNQADKLNGTMGNYFLGELMPRYPIYFASLSQKIKDVIGVPHPDGKKAYEILQSEGLNLDGHHDPFDLGPCLSRDIELIETVKNARQGSFCPLGVKAGLIGQGTNEDFECFYDSEQTVDLSKLVSEYGCKDKINTGQIWIEKFE